MIDRQLEKNFQNTFVTATTVRSQLITVETLLLELLSNDRVSRVLAYFGCSKTQLKRNLEEFIDTKVPKLATLKEDPQPSVGFQRVIERALVHVQQSGRKDQDLHGEDVLVSIFDEPDSWAVAYLTEQGLDKLSLVEYLTDLHRDDYSESFAEPAGPAGDEAPEGGTAGAAILEAFTVNLNEKAKEGKLDPLIGREEEMTRVIQVLCRRRKNNPLLVGEPGVGKTAIAEGVASRIVSGKVPDILKKRVIRSLSMGRLVAGTKYRGDFEDRMKRLVDAVRESPETVLFIDEIHTVIGAGSTSGGQTLDAADLLKPALANGELSCIGATTYEEFRRIFEKDRALARRFQKIDVPAPTADESVQILKGLRAKFEEHHGIKYTDKAIEAAVTLSERYMSDKRLPDKAIDMIDEAGAAQRLLPAESRKGVIDEREIEETIAKMTKIPVATLTQGDEEKLYHLPEDLKKRIFGQDEAVDAVVSAIRLSRAGFDKSDRPVGSFLFTGPTGVGKTELAKQLAESLGVSLIRFDMSEYSEAHTVSRLIGAPPGYVGFSQGGQLTEQVTAHPYCVLLLDEIEKAHPDILNVLLQVMDNGTLTDNSGRKADFRNVILIMTSNAGARMISRNVIGFGETKSEGDDTAEIKKYFSPEFRNRLDAIIRFKPLAHALILKITDKFLKNVTESLRKRNVEPVFTSTLRNYLAEHGFDPQMGARPMRRLIQDIVERPLAEAVLFGPLKNGGKVTVGFNRGKVQLKFPGSEAQGSKKQEALPA